MLTKIATAALAVGISFLALSAPAAAKTILIFAQTGASPPTNFDITDNGNGTTSISADLPVTITALDGPLVPPPITDAVFTFSATSTSAASTFTAAGITFLVQRYSGTFSVLNAVDGTVYLSGTFVDLTSGIVGGNALTIAASQPPSTGVTFTSEVIPPADLAIDKAIALSATNLAIPVTFDTSSPLGSTLGSTSSNLSGTFSAAAGVVPEPSTWVMMMLGFAGLGFAGHRSSRKEIALFD